MQSINHQNLKEDLEQIAKQGITVDVARLKEDMCSQFADPNEWIREYVVNAYDAHARHCWISGWEEKGRIIIAVDDDGVGMGRQRVADFMTLYRSSKSCTNNRKPIGRHGIGKLSVSAVPGQCSFSILTSTGNEAWKMETGSLLDQAPISILPVNPPPLRGTRFEIGFKGLGPLRKVLGNLADILDRYIHYLPIKVIVFELDVEDPKSPYAARPIYASNGNPDFSFETLGRVFSFKLSDMKYTLSIGLGHPVHEIYQNRVLVSDAYNLVFHGETQKPKIPYLSLRVDSPEFELPFGRHCLSNEEVLHPLSLQIRENILPQYLKELFSIYEKGHMSQYGLSSVVVQDIACVMMNLDSSDEKPWCSVPVFAVQNGPRMSLSELRRIVGKVGIAYLESEDDIGVDYSVFDSPVLSLKQPQGALDFLKEQFKDKLVCLDSEDFFFEAPAGARPELGSVERNFEGFLGFHPEVLHENWDEKQEDNVQWDPLSFDISFEELERLRGIHDEMNQAENDLAVIKWRLGYLVKRDGKTPCSSRLFLFRNDNVVLNLYHPLVKKLAKLSEKAPALAGHWALAICITKNKKILPHLSPENREDLILMDAISKCGMKTPLSLPHTHQENLIENRQWQEFLRERDDQRGWLN
ncbi:MAG TPA: ATP-binding protein [Desulfobacteraceae bacterium]|nr:ATP-binding protein [Desulfobacteraceae bacterium]HPJ67023.1 ATP-binding protein [Desulfobacteraceae bacterium]HPQ27289.1 ATP-binding protein [Desulfobacteraceae bacterium]